MLYRGLTDYGSTDLFYYCLVSGMVYVLPIMVFEIWVFYSSDDLLMFTRKKWVIQGMVYGIVSICLIIFQPVG